MSITAWAESVIAAQRANPGMTMAEYPELCDELERLCAAIRERDEVLKALGVEGDLSVAAWSARNRLERYSLGWRVVGARFFFNLWDPSIRPADRAGEWWVYKKDRTYAQGWRAIPHGQHEAAWAAFQEARKSDV